MECLWVNFKKLPQTIDFQKILKIHEELLSPRLFYNVYEKKIFTDKATIK